MICSSPRTIATTRETKVPRTSRTINRPIFLFHVNEIQNHKANSVSLTRNRIFVLRKKKQRMPIEQSSPSAGGGGSSSSSPSSSSSLILTSGASGRINALFSVRSLKSLLMVVYAFVLLLLGPFRGRRRAAAIGSSPRDHHHHHQKSMAAGSGAQRRGNSTTLMPRKGKGSGACAVLDQEVAARRALAIRRVLEDKEKHSDSAREFSLFTSPRGDTIFTQSWFPVSAKIRALVVLLHGLNEHSGRYNDFAKQLNAHGFKVYGMDWIGHGGSDGLHAYVHSLDDAVTDLKFFLDKLLAENPGLPCFCFGHSTGAAIVLKAVLIPEVEARIAGIVLTSPAVGVQPSHPIFVVLAPVFSFLLPRFQLSVANKKGSPVSRDPEALVVKYSDPLVYTGSIRVRTGYEILRITTYLQQNLHNVRVPFLVLHGTADTVTDPDASQKLYEEASSTDKTIKLYEGFLHDLLFELEREDVVNEIIKWLNSRVLG